MVGFQRTGRVWSSGNVPKGPHWPNMWLQPWGRSLNQHLWLVLVCPDSSHADTQQVPLPNALEVSPRCHKERSTLQIQSLGIQGTKKEFSVFYFSHSVSFRLRETGRVIDFTDTGLTSAFLQAQSEREWEENSSGWIAYFQKIIIIHKPLSRVVRTSQNIYFPAD